MIFSCCSSIKGLVVSRVFFLFNRMSNSIILTELRPAYRAQPPFSEVAVHCRLQWSPSQSDNLNIPPSPPTHNAKGLLVVERSIGQEFSSMDLLVFFVVVTEGDCY